MTDAITTTTDRQDAERGRRIKAERDWLAQAGPAPTMEDVARPFLQGLSLLHDINDRVATVSVLADLDRDGLDSWDVDGRTLLVTLRRAPTDIVARYASSCVVPLADHGSIRVAATMRTVMEAILNTDELAGTVET